MVSELKTFNSFEGVKSNVLILVVVEDGLRGVSDDQKNFCAVVLILVVVEDGLRVYATHVLTVTADES